MRHNEIFADDARSMAAFDNAVTGDIRPFASTVACCKVFMVRVDPEMSNTNEPG